MPNNKVIVRGQLGRFIPAGGRCQFLGWRECGEAEQPEATLPAGTGPRDTPQIKIKTATGILTVPPQSHGRELRLVRCEVEVEHDSIVRRAINDGDLEMVV